MTMYVLIEVADDAFDDVVEVVGGAGKGSRVVATGRAAEVAAAMGWHHGGDPADLDDESAQGPARDSDAATQADAGLSGAPAHSYSPEGMDQDDTTEE